MNAFANEKVELTDGQVRWHQVLFLVEIADAGFWCLFDNYLKIETDVTKDSIIAFGSRKQIVYKQIANSLLFIFVFVKKIHFNRKMRL